MFIWRSTGNCAGRDRSIDRSILFAAEPTTSRGRETMEGAAAAVESISFSCKSLLIYVVERARYVLAITIQWPPDFGLLLPSAGYSSSSSPYNILPSPTCGCKGRSREGGREGEGSVRCCIRDCGATAYSEILVSRDLIIEGLLSTFFD